MVRCPACQHEQTNAAAVQGVLGNNVQCRCRYCAVWFAVQQEDYYHDEEYDDVED